jgi:hypothetical protein
MKELLEFLLATGFKSVLIQKPKELIEETPIRSDGVFFVSAIFAVKKILVNQPMQFFNWNLRLQIVLRERV